MPEDWKSISDVDALLVRVEARTEGDGQLLLPTLARLWLKELAKVGLNEVDSSSGFAPKEPTHYLLRTELLTKDIYPIKLEGSREVLWLKLNGRRSEQGYRPVELMIKPSKTDTAIIAALTALEAKKLKSEKLSDSLVGRALDNIEQRPQIGSEASDESTEELDEELLRTLRELAEDRKELRKRVDELVDLPVLEYVIVLLRHYRPEFDDLDRKEKLALVKAGYTRVQEFSDSLRKLMAFLEHGAPDKDLRTRAGDAASDIVAAELKEVEDLSNPKLGDVLGIAPPPSDRNKRTNKTAGDKAKRGKNLVVSNLGEEFWCDLIEAKKADRDRFLSLSEEEQHLEQFAEDEDLSLEYARHLIEEARDKLEPTE